MSGSVPDGSTHRQSPSPHPRRRPAGPGNLVLLAFAVIGVVLILVPLSLLFVDRSVDRQFDEISNTVDPVAIALARLRLGLERFHTEAAHLALSPNADSSEYRTLEQRYDGDRAGLEGAAEGTQYEPAVAALLRRADAAKAGTDAAVEAMLEGNPEDGMALLVSEAWPTLGVFTALASDLRQQLDTDREALRERGVTLTTVDLVIGMLGSLLGAVVILTLLGMTLSRRRLLAESERDRARFIGMVEATGFGVMEVNSDGEITYVNPAAADLARGQTEDLIGTRARRLVEEDAPLRAAIGSRQPFSGEVRAQRLDGTWMTLDVSSRPFGSPGDPYAGTVIVFQDLTERFERERQRARFVSMASHELRSPLTSLVGFSRRLARAVAEGRLKVDEESAEAIETLRDEAQRMQETVTLFLDMTRLDANVLELVIEPVALDRLVEREVESLRRRHPDLRLSLQDTGGEAIVETDGQRARQVLEGLLDNAVTHGGDPAEVTVRIEPEGEGYAVYVRDNGPGIAPEDRDRVFERFYQSAGAVRRHRGLGLGLAIARELADHLGAQLTFTTELGQGTEFRLWLPSEPGNDVLPVGGGADTQRSESRITWSTTS